MGFVTLMIFLLIFSLALAIFGHFLFTILDRIFPKWRLAYGFLFWFSTETCLGSIIGSFIAVGIYWLGIKLFGSIVNKIAAVAAGEPVDLNKIRKVIKIIPFFGALGFFLLFGMNNCGIWRLFDIGGHAIFIYSAIFFICLAILGSFLTI